MILKVDLSMESRMYAFPFSCVFGCSGFGAIVEMALKFDLSMENKMYRLPPENPPAPWVPGCEASCFILYPASSVVMKACYSLDFPYFRNLHPGFFVSLHSCRFDTVFSCCKIGFCHTLQTNKKSFENPRCPEFN